MNDLTTQEGIYEAEGIIEKSFLTALREYNFEVAPDAVCNVDRSSITMGIGATGSYMDKGFKMAFASEIQLYAANKSDVVLFGREYNEINFGSSGAFTPNVRESYWRTIHAASILKNWSKASEIVNTHCKMMTDLEQEIRKQNKKITTT